MNTFGLHSIHLGTFNLQPDKQLFYPRDVRNIIVTALRIHNLILNILGYIGGTIGLISGCCRIISGFSIIATTLAIGERKASQGLIIQHWYDEAILTGIAQITRGIFEAFVPYGRAINIGIDVVSTVSNLVMELQLVKSNGIYRPPHDEPNYILPFKLLYLA